MDRVRKCCRRKLSGIFVFNRVYLSILDTCKYGQIFGLYPILTWICASKPFMRWDVLLHARCALTSVGVGFSFGDAPCFYCMGNRISLPPTNHSKGRITLYLNQIVAANYNTFMGLLIECSGVRWWSCESSRLIGIASPSRCLSMACHGPGDQHTDHSLNNWVLLFLTHCSFSS
jgi:hypothetical protein